MQYNAEQRCTVERILAGIERRSAGINTEIRNYDSMLKRVFKSRSYNNDANNSTASQVSAQISNLDNLDLESQDMLVDDAQR